MEFYIRIYTYIYIYIHTHIHTYIYIYIYIYQIVKIYRSIKMKINTLNKYISSIRTSMPEVIKYLGIALVILLVFEYNYIHYYFNNFIKYYINLILKLIIIKYNML